MTIQELATSKDSPLSDEQKQELQNEYFNKISELEGKIRVLERLNNQKAMSIDQMKQNGDELVTKAVACVESVKVMLEHSNSCGATHRMKGFYSDAMVKYIDKIAADLKNSKIYDNYPF